MSEPSSCKGPCNHCSGNIEFPAELTGQEAQCPHCANFTELSVGTRPESPVVEAASDVERRGSRARLFVGTAVTALVVIGVIVAFAFFHHPARERAKAAGEEDESVLPSARSRRAMSSSMAPLPPPKPKSRVNVLDLIRFEPLPASAGVAEDQEHPPIPIRFILKTPGNLTLVIENAKGERVRNLVSDTAFPAGVSTVWWDGRDETPGKSGPGGAYELTPRLVPPGSYRVRGLFHQGIDMIYDFSVYSPGDPPWDTEDGSGCWTSDVIPPSSVAFLPGVRQMAIGSRGSEGGHGLIFTDLSGNKLRGFRYVAAGTWTGAEFLARDRGEKAATNIFAYAGIGYHDWDDRTQGQVHLAALTEGEPVLMLKESVEAPAQRMGRFVRAALQMRGLAVHNGLAIASLQPSGQLIFADASAPLPSKARQVKANFGSAAGYGKTLGRVKLDDARGLAFDKQGRLLALVGSALHRYTVDKLPPAIANRHVLVASGLEDPQGIALDETDTIYISDWGNSHQVKVFSPEGKFLRVIGKPGAPRAGPYDPERMQHPCGMAVTDDGKLWVAENDYLPKRISVWTTEGKLLRDHLGPVQYGGGGEMDPRDKSRFYYVEQRGGAMEFQLDWKAGSSRLKSIYYRPGTNDLQLNFEDDGRPRVVAPQTPVYLNNRQYMVNVFNGHPSYLTRLLGVWVMREGRAVLVAAVGDALAWDLLKSSAYRSRWPAGVDPSLLSDPRNRRDLHVLFAWTDRNGDGRGQPEEVTMLRTPEQQNCWFFSQELTAISESGYQLTPQGFTTGGAPVFDATKARHVLPKGVIAQTGILAHGNRLVLCDGPLSAYKDGKLEWTYPNQWPTLGAGHKAPHQTYPGQLLATTKPISYPFTVSGSDAGPLWAYNSDRAQVYLFTLDGLFVTQLFQDSMRWDVPRWTVMPWQRGMRVNEVATYGENFWPRVVQTDAGEIFLVSGKNHSGIIRLHGLEAVQRLPVSEILLTPQLLAGAKQWLTKNTGTNRGVQFEAFLRVPVRKSAPTLDGKLDDWQGVPWATIEQRATAAVVISGDRLYAAFRAEGQRVLQNSGASVPLLFKTGNALDLMIGTDVKADPNRRDPVAGDVRLLVAQANGKTVAALFRPVVPGTPKDAGVPFSSTDRTIRFDRVDDVSDQVQLAAGENVEPGPYNRKIIRWSEYEISIPLSVLGLKAQQGQRIRADLGVLRGNANTTLQRSYWSNKNTGLVNDVPGEAQLTPNRWGQWLFE